ncbi:PREDICTED: probable BOI-related E3 ubiquitin-protein ligase 2 [Populus euphratica]|uniref:Probable BOI-related E3 ubiquitin-protein ligase 2 n=1 Tax=Populus euphratica TaxID=75702 RepID=A0AAJ6Y8R8_POPEU|nr:PREDICTED: probable BOI-related E3 ubiquitin-protein ligase 2 [Populus euphratica]
MAIQAQFPYCGGSQDLMDYGCGGLNQYFNVQQQKQQQQQQQCNMHQLLNYQLQRNQNLFFDNTLASASKNNNSDHLSMGIMASYDEKQRQEIDHYIRLQDERLRLVLQEQKRQQLSLLLKKVESKALPILKQKDEEIAQAAKRTVELEDFLKKLEFENQTWQRMAQENEAKVISLNNTIEQLRENASSCFNNGAEDAESCCDVSREEEWFLDDADDTARKMVMVCKVCNSRNSCILFLPCRHLCSCKACDACLDACPVCQTPKKASIEALMV